ncbi:MAG: hypothetical protein N6V41_01465, partial [Candidatus Portiera aleyrodidarum]|nr:hypothetical protein [Candidatus Portiera aleyrodidarum]
MLTNCTHQEEATTRRRNRIISNSSTTTTTTTTSTTNSLINSLKGAGPIEATVSELRQSIGTCRYSNCGTTTT